MSWPKLVEERIQEAFAKGEFDDLPGKGRPIDLSEYFRAPASDRMSHSLLKNAGVLPTEVEAMREIAALEKSLVECADPASRAEFSQQLQSIRVSLSISLERRRRQVRADASLDPPIF